MKLGPAFFQRSVYAVALATLAACSTRMDQAPVVDRSGSVLSTQALVPFGPPPPGYYRVKPGDTLYRIALENGQNYRDIAAWNNLTNPNQIEVDQLLRVAPSGAEPAAGTPGVSTAPVGGGAVQSLPLDANPTASPAAPYGAAPSAAPSAPPDAPGSGGMPFAARPPAPSARATPAANDGSISFTWPVRGPILDNFDDSKNKGLNIGGALGAPITAAADGRVVYAGSGLRGYGNLIIIKHDATFLSAYAHNRALLVKEGESVSRGQKIAEIGNSDSDRVMLHFEVRRQGKPVDPLKYLPPR